VVLAAVAMEFVTVKQVVKELTVLVLAVAVVVLVVETHAVVMAVTA
jgi:hypothetical protein